MTENFLTPKYLPAIFDEILSPPLDCGHILWMAHKMNAFRPGKRLRFASCNPTSHYLPLACWFVCFISLHCLFYEENKKKHDHYALRTIKNVTN